MTETKRKYKRRKTTVKKSNPMIWNKEIIEAEDKVKEEVLKPIKIKASAVVKKSGGRKKKFFLIYEGLHEHISVSGLGRVKIGQRYPVKESIANAFRGLEDWRVDEEYEFEKLKK